MGRRDPVGREVGKTSRSRAFRIWLMLMAPGEPAPATPRSRQRHHRRRHRLRPRRSERSALPSVGNAPWSTSSVLKKQVLFLGRKKILAPPPQGALWNLLRLLRATGKGLNSALREHDLAVAGAACAPPTAGSQVPPRRPAAVSASMGWADMSPAFLPLARGLADGRPVYGLQAQGLEPGQEPHDRIEAMAARYVKEIRGVQPRGPYLLGGWSMGGLIALEAARQLLAAGQAVALVALLDTYLSMEDFPERGLDDTVGAPRHRSATERSDRRTEEPAAGGSSGSGSRNWPTMPAESGSPRFAAWPRPARHICGRCRAMNPPYAGRAFCFGPETAARVGPPLEGTLSETCVEPVPGDHFSMLREPHVQVLADGLGRFLQACDGRRRGDGEP